MPCKERYFYGKRQEVGLKLYGAMAEKIRSLSAEDTRGLNNEITYLLGCKLEGIDNSIRRRTERETHANRLRVLQDEASKLYRTLIAVHRPKEVDLLLPELKSLFIEIQNTRLAIDAIPAHQETGEPGL